MKKIFEIKKQRNLDEIVEDSFKFFKRHVKPIIKIIWEQNRFILAGLLISYFLYIYLYFGSLNNILKINSKEIETGSQVDMFTPEFALVGTALFIFSLIFLPRFFAAITGYIKYYKPETNSVDIDKLKAFVNNKFWGLIGLSITIFILLILAGLISFIFIGLLGSAGSAGVFLIFALLLPAVFYAIVYFTLVYYVYVFEDIDISTALSKTKQYLKQRFWFSLLVILVMSIILWLIGMVFNAPVSIYVFVKMLMMVKQPDAASTPTGDIFVAILSVISYIAQLVIRIIFIIAMSFLYFSLKEYHTSESLHEKIDQIGSDYEERDF